MISIGIDSDDEFDYIEIEPFDITGAMISFVGNGKTAQLVLNEIGLSDLIQALQDVQK